MWPDPKAAEEQASVQRMVVPGSSCVYFALWRNLPVSVAICEIVQGDQRRDIYNV